MKIHAIDLITAAACEVSSVSTMSRKTQVKKQLILKPIIVKSTSVKPLRTVPFESGFHFYTAIGNYAGITATNLNEFAAKLQTIPIESINFQKWIQYTIEDAPLAERISRIKGEQSAEGLRKEILRTVEAVSLNI